MKPLDIILVGLIVLMCSSCTKNFEEINVDPNNVVAVPTNYLLTQAQRHLVLRNIDVTPIYYTQMWSANIYTGSSVYDDVDESFNDYYAGGLINLQQIIELNSDDATKNEVLSGGSNSNQIAVARILKAWIFQVMTDHWGDIPYSEALAGSENFNPVYDTQESIYADLVKELIAAAAQINIDETPVSGDIIYDGDMDKWKKFAASLLLRVGIRMSKVNANGAAQAINSGISIGTFADNTDNAIFSFLPDQINNNPLYRNYTVLSREDFAVSELLHDYLNKINDPRLKIYADPTRNSQVEWRESNPIPSLRDHSILKTNGMIYGVLQATAASIPNEEVSYPGQAVRQAESPFTIMSLAEVLFIKAEAAARGWIGTLSDAATYYNDAIRASIENELEKSERLGFLPDDADWAEFFVPKAADVDIDGYLGQEEVAFDINHFERSIGYQKWLALYLQGDEAWAEWRRLGYPILQPAPDATENRQIPRRRAYPQSERDLNAENYEAAIARQGPDELETRVWWDK